jgi:hypothetical protein
MNIPLLSAAFFFVPRPSEPLGGRFLLARFPAPCKKIRQIVQ